MNALRHGGFTLIELLCVIAILAIIAAILFPVFGQVRRRSKTAVCLSNLGQIGVATALYETDYDQQPPVENPRQAMHEDKTCDDPLRPYGTIAAIFHCPNYAPTQIGDRRLSNEISDYRFRFVLMLMQLPSHLSQFWQIMPDDNTVIAFCYWDTANPHQAPDDGFGNGYPNGSMNALRHGGAAQRIPTAALRVHYEDWGGFGSSIDPGGYTYYQFPGESWPPSVIRLP